MKENVEEFKKKGYVFVKNALNKELVDFITQYALFDEMQDFTPDDVQVVGAHAKYADPVMETLLLNYKKLLKKIQG